jgi:uncharacterized protein
MSHYFYRGLLAVGIAALLVLFVYGTHLTTEPASMAKFGNVSLRIEYATTSASRERGLGGRESVAPDYGMLFVFPKDERYGFWMKDMLVPIDMFWLDSEGHVVSIAPRIATSTYPNVFYPTAPARYVLETAAGFAQEHGITTGTPLLLKNFPSVTE